MCVGEFHPIPFWTANLCSKGRSEFGSFLIVSAQTAVIHKSDEMGFSLTYGDPPRTFRSDCTYTINMYILMWRPR